VSVKSTLQPVLRRNLIIDQLVKDKRYSLFTEIANRECKFLHKIFKKSSVKHCFSGMAGRGFSALIAGKGVKTSVIFPSFFRHLAILSSKLIRHFKISDVKQLGQAVCFAAMGVMCTIAAVSAWLVFAAQLTAPLQANVVLNTMKLANSLCGGTPQSAGVGRERMRGQFAGYIPANRAEKFREAERS